MKKWKLIDTKKVLENKWFTVSKNTYDIGNGKTGDDYYHIDRSDYVLVIAEDHDGKVIVTRQYRWGADKILYDLPAGYLEKNESPVKAAERELQEETGYRGKGILIGTLASIPGYMTSTAYVVKIDIEDKVEGMNKDDDETIEVYKFSIEEVKQMLKDNKFMDMGSVAAFGVYLINENK